MEIQSILVIVHLFLAIGLVGLILIQHGKGADMGAAFGAGGGGASSSVFGSRGASNFLSRTTGILAALFFATSLTLAYFSMQSTEPETLMEGLEAPAAETAPEVPFVSDMPSLPDSAPDASALPDVPPSPSDSLPSEAADDVPQVEN